ncbi:MAG: SEC-C domain-containing protein [Halanaerobiales bacterium]|nr:SEC-C domain-containing protein [Halanaerobiales bacterium]
MEDKLFNKQDYLNYSEHDEDLVKEWAVENLVKLYPDDEEVKDRMFSLMKECGDNDDLRIDLQKYFEGNYDDISGEDFLENIEAMDSLLKKSILIENLAQKNYREDKAFDYIKNILKRHRPSEANVFHKLVSALGYLRTSDAYELLQRIGEEIDLDFMFLNVYSENMFKYRRKQDIAEFFRKVVTNVAAVGTQNLKGILTSYSKLFYGHEFTNYLLNIVGYKDGLYEIMDLLESYWGLNNGVILLDPLFNESDVEAFYNGEYKQVFTYLIEQLNNEFVDKYPDLVQVDMLPLSIDQLVQIRGYITEEDFWICLAMSILDQEKDNICEQEDIKFIINFMISLLIVLLEDNDFENMITQAENSLDALWDAFAVDCCNIPEEIIEMTIEKGTILEDRLIDLIKNNRYDNYVERTVKVLGEIKSKKSIPYLINLLDKHQGDYICEQVSSILIDMYEFISLEELEEAICSGDSTRRIFLTDLFGYFPCDSSARIMTNLWEKAVLDVYEQFVFTLRDIGSNVGLQYLDNICEDDDMPYAFESLLVLAIINNKDKKTVNYYRKQIKRANDRRASRSNNFLDRFKRKYMQQEKRQDMQSKQDGDFDQGKYIVNEDGTRIKKADIGRNDPCPCGSGKKYKKCCGR